MKQILTMNNLITELLTITFKFTLVNRKYKLSDSRGDYYKSIYKDGKTYNVYMLELIEKIEQQWSVTKKDKLFEDYSKLIDVREIYYLKLQEINNKFFSKGMSIYSNKERKISFKELLTDLNGAGFITNLKRPIHEIHDSNIIYSYDLLFIIVNNFFKYNWNKIIVPLIQTLETRNPEFKKPQQKKKKKKEITFKSLFRNPKHPDEVKKILEDNYFTKNGIWIHDGKKNTLATAYYVLSDPEPTGNIHAILPNNNTTAQLRTFYNEFGLKIAEKMEEGVYTTIKNATKRPQYDINETDTYKFFQELFSSLAFQKQN